MIYTILAEISENYEDLSMYWNINIYISIIFFFIKYLLGKFTFYRHITESIIHDFFISILAINYKKKKSHFSY